VIVSVKCALQNEQTFQCVNAVVITLEQDAYFKSLCCNWYSE